VGIRAGAVALGTGVAAVCAVPLVISVTADAASDVLLSKRRPVVASSESGGHGAAQAVDGYSGTRWAAGAAGTQWLRIDLGKVQNVNRVRLRWQEEYARTYRIQVSNDGANWRDVHRTAGGDGGTDDLKKLSGAGRAGRPAGAGVSVHRLGRDVTAGLARRDDRAPLRQQHVRRGIGGDGDDQRHGAHRGDSRAQRDRPCPDTHPSKLG